MSLAADKAKWRRQGDPTRTGRNPHEARRGGSGAAEATGDRRHGAGPAGRCGRRRFTPAPYGTYGRPRSAVIRVIDTRSIRLLCLAQRVCV